MTIKDFSIEYDAINSQNTFTNGDTINGRVILEVSKETKIQSLVFIGKGKANVCWSEHYGQYNTVVYHSNEKYYDVKHHILRKARQDGTEVIGKGRHVFPFSFQIPNRKIPSSFKSSVGKVVHKLKAELKQSMKVTKTAKTHFTFVSKADMDIPGLIDPQYGCKDKTVKVFGSGTISMDVHTKRMGYIQGNENDPAAEGFIFTASSCSETGHASPSYFREQEMTYATTQSGDHTTLVNLLLGDENLIPYLKNASSYFPCEDIQVTVEVKNHSTRSVKPKIILYEKKSYFAMGRRKVCTNEILKEKIEAVASSENKTVTKVITIPKELPTSILNCSIIKLEYRLKISLDVKYAVDPKIKLPIVVLPEARPMKHPPPVCGFDTFGNMNEGAWARAPQPQASAFDPPPPYGACAISPSSYYRN